MKAQRVVVEYAGISGQVQVNAICDDGVTKVYLWGDRDGLRSLSDLLKTLANVDQQTLPGLPERFATEHVHLEPSLDLTKSSSELVVGRLDDKSGSFDESIIPRDTRMPRPIRNDWGTMF